MKEIKFGITNAMCATPHDAIISHNAAANYSKTLNIIIFAQISQCNLAQFCDVIRRCNVYVRAPFVHVHVAFIQGHVTEFGTLTFLIAMLSPTLIGINRTNVDLFVSHLRVWNNIVY